MGLDAYTSSRRVAVYGTQVELNPLIRKAFEQGFGVEALLAYNAILLGAPALFHYVGLLTFLVGMKSGLGLLQLHSLLGSTRDALHARSRKRLRP